MGGVSKGCQILGLPYPLVRAQGTDGLFLQGAEGDQSPEWFFASSFSPGLPLPCQHQARNLMLHYQSLSFCDSNWHLWGQETGRRSVMRMTVAWRCLALNAELRGHQVHVQEFQPWTSGKLGFPSPTQCDWWAAFILVGHVVQAFSEHQTAITLEV